MHDLLCEDLYAALPELRPHPKKAAVKQTKRGFGAAILSVVPGLITLAVESIGSWIKGKQQKHIDEAILLMRKQEEETNRLHKFSTDFLMYGKYNVETLEDVVDTVNKMYAKQMQMEQAAAGAKFGNVKSIIAAMTFSFDLQLFIKVSEEEHVKQLQILEASSQQILRGISILSQGRLPQEFFLDCRLYDILKEVQTMVSKDHPDYALAAEHISHYRDMKLVIFAVDQETHSLIVTFPVFIHDYRRPPLSLYEIETVPAPIPDQNERANSYSEVMLCKPYIAVGAKYYIELRMTEMIMCKEIRFTYYCEELFVVKHKSVHSCSSAIFYEFVSKIIVSSCDFQYTYDKKVLPVILDSGNELLIANFHGSQSLKCDSNDGGLAKPAPEHTYAMVSQEFLCD